MRNKIAYFLALILMTVIVTILLLPASHFWTITPGRDAGVFTYIGAEILNGRLPYRDVWDHKPPLIYYIDALGLFISQGAEWGIWLIQFIFLYLTGIVGFALLRRDYGTTAALIGCLAFVLGFRIIPEGGNSVQHYALLWQFMAIYLFVDARLYPSEWRDYALGVTGALAFLLQQNLIGVWIAIGIYMLIDTVGAKQKQRGANLLSLSRMVVGGTVPLLLVATYFLAQGAFDEMIDAIFAYNFAHVGSTETSLTLRDWFVVLTDGLYGIKIRDANFPPFILMPAAWIIVAVYCVVTKNWQRQPVVGLSLLLMPIEIVLADLSGYGYSHYHLAWLPVYVVVMAIVAYALIQLMSQLRTRYQSLEQVSQILSRLIQVGILIGIFYIITPDVGIFLEKWREYPDKVLTKVSTFTAEYIRLNTHPDDYVLVWGAQSEVYFWSERQPPTRFVYQYPLTKLGYDVESATSEFYQDLLEHPPTLIIDTRNDAYSLPPLDAELARHWQPRPGHFWHDGLQPVIDFFNENYELEFEVAHAWYIYRLREPDS
jgi:hypothetical protein